MLPKPTMTQAAPVKFMLNIGATMDIPTGFYVKGVHGEHLLVGGLGYLTGITGRGNCFKSTIMHYMTLSAADRLSSTAETSINTYDTEMNIHEERLRALAGVFPSFNERDILNDGTWVVTDKTVYYGNEWFTKLKEYLDKKKTEAPKLTYETPFLDRDGKSSIKMMIPTFSQVDSFSAFETSDVAKIQDENELGDSGGNTIHMRQGLAKLRFLMEIPGIGASTNHFTILTAHMGQDMAIASGPYSMPPPKKLQHMRQGEKIKGVTDQFFFLTNNFWQMVSATPLVNQSTKAAEYPKNTDDNEQGDMDLNVVTMKSLRNKSGQSGVVLEIIVSQIEGVLPGLTEFNFIKSAERFGIAGTLQHYNLALYPDCKLSRTTVRGKIDNDPKLRRALNITAELLQLYMYHKPLREILMEPDALYTKIKDAGYDWDFILSSTRGWWTVNNDSHPLFFLSTLDLVYMANGTYHPYWLESDKKTVKKQYQKK